MSRNLLYGLSVLLLATSVFVGCAGRRNCGPGAACGVSPGGGFASPDPAFGPPPAQGLPFGGSSTLNPGAPRPASGSGLR